MILKKKNFRAALFVLLALAGAASISGAENEKIKIVVLPFKPSGDGGRTAGDLVRGILAADDRFELPAGPLPERDADNAYRADDASPDVKRLKKLAKSAGVSKIILGSARSDRERISVRGFVYSASQDMMEYETEELSAPGSGPEEAAAQVAGRIALWLKGALPVVVALKGGEGASEENVTLSWEARPEAPEYRVYRAVSEAGEFAEIGSSTAPSYSDADAIPGVRYHYRVRALSGTVRSDFSAVSPGYRKITPPRGLSIETIMKERTENPPPPSNEEEKEKIRREEGILKPFYIDSIQLNLTIFFANSYVKSGKISILRDFDDYTINEESKEIVLESKSAPYIINFKCKRLFRLKGEAGMELFDRLVRNALLYCVHTGDRETLMEDGTVYMVPAYEAVGMSTGYFRNDKNWLGKTIMLSTDNKEYKDRMKKVREDG